MDFRGRVPTSRIKGSGLSVGNAMAIHLWCDGGGLVSSTITLKGRQSLTKAKVSLKTPMRIWDTYDQGFLVECRLITIEPQLLTVETRTEAET